MGMPPSGMGRSRPRNFLTEEEKQQMPVVSGALIKRIIGYMKPYWLQFTLVLAVILASAFIGLLPALITRRIVDEALIGRDMELLIKLVLAAFGTVVLSQAMGMLEGYINTWISFRIIFDMKNEMYDHLQYMPHSFFTTEKQGDVITRMESDISGVSSVISGTLSSIVSAAAVLVTTLVALFTMSWQLAIVGVAVVPLLIAPTRKAGRSRWSLLAEGQEKRDELNQLINETLSVSGSLLVKLFTREKAEYERFRRVNDESTRLSVKEQRAGKWFFMMLGVFTQIAPLLIYAAGGIFMMGTVDPALTVGTITATVALVNRLYRPVQTLLNIQVDFTRSLALFTRIFDYLDRKNPITNCKEPKTPPFENADVAFSHVDFSYNAGRKVLRDVSFIVPGGSMYAIVGPSGSGKSTTVNLIPRIYDTDSGSVSIGGVDVKNIDLRYLRANIGVVTQDTYLFNGTVRDNLLIARDGATQGEIEQACRTANIHDFIMSQPAGYDTVVGNRGLKLSGGEKQRVSIARVLLKDPALLILDEATSSLDSISENSIQEALEAAMRGRTSIVIAHRLSTVLAADRIIVIKDGTVAEEGTHEALLEKNGVYRELYETQFRRVLELERAEHGAQNEKN